MTDLIILWDHTSTATPIKLHPCKNSNISVLAKEKVLSLGCRYLETQGKKSGFFYGSVHANKEAKGILITVDKFDENLINSSAILPYEIAIPFSICKIGEQHNAFQIDDCVTYSKKLFKHSSSREAVNLANSILLSMQCFLQGGRCEIVVSAITCDIAFKAILIPPIPIYDSKLINILSNPSSDTLGVSSSGLLTIDFNKKLNFLSDTDPRISTTSIVGIWIAGVASLEHPVVWASCLRYVSCSDYTERVCLPPKPFLLIIYNSITRKMEFYDCLTSDGLSKVSLNLLEGKCSLTIPKIPSFSSKISRIELKNSQDEVFLKNLKMASETIYSENLTKPRVLEKKIGSNIADMPRTIPRSSLSKAHVLKPLVADISILSDNGLNHDLIPNRTPLKTINDNSKNTPRNRYSPPEFIAENSQIRGGLKLNENKTVQHFKPQLITRTNPVSTPINLTDNCSITTPVNVRVAANFQRLKPAEGKLHFTPLKDPVILDDLQINSCKKKLEASHEITNMLKNQDEQLKNLQEQVQKLLEGQESQKLSPVELKKGELVETQPVLDDNSELLNMLQHQDQQLLKLQEQVAQMLSMQNTPECIETNTQTQENVSNCSIGIMTSMVTTEHTQDQNVRHHFNDVSGKAKKNCSRCENSKTISSKGHASNSASYSNQVIPVEEKSQDLPDSFIQDRDANDISFYQKILYNVNRLLTDSKNSKEDSFRQVDSLYLPRLNYQTLHLKECEDNELPKNDFDALAMKYLGPVKKVAPKPAVRHSPRAVFEHQCKNVSFATRAYLDRHNLTPVSEEQTPLHRNFLSPQILFPYSEKPPQYQNNNNIRVLNIEELQRQPKLL